MAERWFASTGGALDGIVAKRLDAPYQPGERAMIKVKNYRSADCVVGGFRYNEGKRTVGSLLLGLYDDAGLLNHVGFTSSLNATEKKSLTPRLEKLIAPPGFTGDKPGGPSRWSTKRSAEWQPLKPKLVVEVCYDHFSGGRFRHGTRLLRWRPDKAPRQCTMEQVTQKKADLLKLLR
jgi:ATP-dependent DNA ligase